MSIDTPLDVLLDGRARFYAGSLHAAALSKAPERYGCLRSGLQERRLSRDERVAKRTARDACQNEPRQALCGVFLTTVPGYGT